MRHSCTGLPHTQNIILSNKWAGFVLWAVPTCRRGFKDNQGRTSSNGRFWLAEPPVCPSRLNSLEADQTLSSAPLGGPDKAGCPSDRDCCGCRYHDSARTSYINHKWGHSRWFVWRADVTSCEACSCQYAKHMEQHCTTAGVMICQQLPLHHI